MSLARFTVLSLCTIIKNSNQCKVESKKLTSKDDNSYRLSSLFTQCPAWSAPSPAWPAPGWRWARWSAAPPASPVQPEQVEKLISPWAHIFSRVQNTVGRAQSRLCLHQKGSSQAARAKVPLTYLQLMQMSCCILYTRCKCSSAFCTPGANVLLHSVHLVQISCCILYTWCKCPSALCTTGAHVPLHSVQLVLLSLWVCILWRCCYCLAVSLLVSSCIVFNKSKCLLVVWVTGIIFLPLNNFFSDVVFFLFSMCVSLDYTG